MQSRNINKNRNLQQYADIVFFGAPFSQTSSTLLKNGHLFLSIFGERCHFFSGLFKE